MQRAKNLPLSTQENDVMLKNSEDLRQLGLKVTGPRMKILQIFEQSPTRHLSAEEIYQLLCDAKMDVGFATVYRVLTQFEVAGIVRRHHFAENHSVFELNQGDHHDHLVCDRCGRVEEFLDEVIEERQRHIAEAAGFKMTAHSLNIHGICSECSE